MNFDAEYRKKLKELCDAALELARHDRAAFLNVACDGDVQLRAELESLLAHEETARDFLQQPAWQQVVAQMEVVASEDLTGTELGHYEIRARIGAGGMGEVWKAWDEKLRREVGIKILPAEFAADPERIARFQQEARAASALEHANIITIHEVGQVGKPHAALHFIVTEFIEGQTLREYLTQPRSWRDAVFIATQIASALSAAHAADLIHRDIKPENIMVRANGQVKVLDFGIAKLSENYEGGRMKDEVASDSQLHPSSLIRHPSLTAPGARLGTVRYMSPEQARGEVLDGRTDIFSLGIVLYEMLTGRRPYGQAEGDEMIRQLTSTTEIEPISNLRPDLPAALDRIVTRALRKNRDERYASANELLNDLKELRINREEKGLQRLRTQSANQILTQFVVRYDEDKTTRIPLGGLWTIWRFADLKRGKLERELIHKSGWNLLWRLVGLMLGMAAVTTAIAAWASVTETWEEKVLRDGHTGSVRAAAFSPDGRMLVSVSEDKQVIVWDFAKRERLATFNDHTDVVAAVAFSPDGRRFATGSSDKTVIVWDAVKLQKEAVLRGHRAKVVGLAFSPDGQMVASSDISVQSRDCTTLVWRVGSWEKSLRVPLACGGSPLLFTGGGKRLIVPNDAGVQNLPNTWDVATGQPRGNEIAPAWQGNAKLSPDGSLLLSMNGNAEVVFIDFKRQRELDRFKILQDYGRAVAFSPDSRLAVTGAENVILWDAVTRRKITTIDYPSVWNATFSPDGRWLVTTHGDGTIRVWDVLERQPAVDFNEHSGFVKALAWARDGRRIASAGADRSIMIWDVARGRRERALFGHAARVSGLAFTPAGDGLISLDHDGVIIIWDLTQGQGRLRFRTTSKKGFIGFCLALSPDGRWVATSEGVYETGTGRQVADFLGGNYPRDTFTRIYSVDFSADGKQLIVATVHDVPFLCETGTWKLLGRANARPSNYVSVRFASDGKRLVTGEDGGLVQVWTSEPLRPMGVIGQHTARVKSVAFSPDGTRVASASDDKTIALWDVGSRRLVTRIGLHTSPVLAVAFSPDGKQIVSGGQDRSVRLYTRRHSLWGWRWE